MKTAGLPNLLNDSGILSSNLNVEMIDLIRPNRGSGLGLDLGASYAPSEKLKLSCSITDLGRIQWRNDLRSYSSGVRAYSFSGIDYVLTIDSLKNIEEKWQSVADSLLNHLKIREVNPISWRTKLRTAYHLAASYKLSDRLQCGSIVSSRHTPSGMRSALSTYIQWNAARFVQIRTSYTLSEGTLAHLGGGFCLRMGPIQWYLISDNWSLLFLPERSTLVHAQTGINLLFGSGKSRD